jgi:hypothetical protein
VANRSAANTCMYKSISFSIISEYIIKVIGFSLRPHSICNCSTQRHSQQQYEESMKLGWSLPTKVFPTLPEKRSISPLVIISN